MSAEEHKIITLDGHPRMILLEIKGDLGKWYLVCGKSAPERAKDGSFKFSVELFYVPNEPAK